MPGNKSVLYRGISRAGQIIIQEKKYLTAEGSSRYCDLYFREDTLYLLKTSYNVYEIRYIKLDYSSRIATTDSLINPPLYLSLTDYVRQYSHLFNTNIEGITMDNSKNFFIVSDNYNGDPICEGDGQGSTLLMKVLK